MSQEKRLGGKMLEDTRSEVGTRFPLNKGYSIDVSTRMNLLTWILSAFYGPMYL